MKKYPVGDIVTNLLILLYGTKNSGEKEKQHFQKIMKSIGADNAMIDTRLKKLKRDSFQLAVPGDEESKITLLYFMVLGTFFSQKLSEERAGIVKKYCSRINKKSISIDTFLRGLPPPDFSKPVRELITNIQAAMQSSFSSARPVKKGPREKEITLYIANQITKEGIDELQALFLCHTLGLNAALDGPPGVGKTRSVIELSHILGMRLFTKTCSSRTTESHIISHPVLVERNGVSVTDHENGPLCLAMLTPGIFYGDEYNLLKEDVQKRMNSVFDERRYIDRNDGKQIKAKDGFFAVISYNPSKNISMRDLEDSVADRFVHFHYKPWLSDLHAYISSLRAWKKMANRRQSFNQFNIKLELRGISGNGHFYKKDGSAQDTPWFDFFTGREMKNTADPDFIYYAHKVKNMNEKDKATVNAINNLAGKAFSEVELARIISRFVEMVNDLSISGKSPLLSKLGLDEMNKKEDLALLTVHRCSIRIQVAALLHYNYLIARGWNKYLAQSYAASILINQMCYGSYREKTLRNITNYSLLNTIARAFTLYADDTVYNTDLVKKSLL
jgi:hypothetical protein